MKTNEIKLGYSELTETVYAGKLNKQGNKWLDKIDITNMFYDCVIAKWENSKQIISNGSDKWEIIVKKIK